MPVGYTPIYRIDQDGIDITDRFNDRVVKIDVILTAGGGNQDTCTIMLDDRDWKIESPAVGKKIEIFLGYKEVGLAQQNVFEINTVEYLGIPRTIQITGTAVGMMTSVKAPAIKNFEGKSLKDIVEDVAKKAGVTAMVEQGLDEIKVPFLNQTQSSMHLLQELERRYGGLAKFDSGKLVFVPRNGNESASGIALPTLLLRPEHMGVWSVRHNERSSYSGVRAAYMDEDTHQPKWIEEANPNGPKGEDGKAEKLPYRMPAMHANKGEAEQAARSMVSALNRSRGEANITLSKGDPWIRDNRAMLIADMREGINGSYVTERVTHTYQKHQALVTIIVAKPPGDASLETSLSNDNQIQVPTPGSKLGGRFVPPVFDAA